MSTQTKTKCCKCIEMCNAEMKKQGLNTVIVSLLEIDFASRKTLPPRCYIDTCKADTKVRKGPVKLSAAYCPFCGKKYPW